MLRMEMQQAHGLIATIGIALKMRYFCASVVVVDCSIEYYSSIGCILP